MHESCLIVTRTTRTPAFWDTPSRPMITHTSDSHQIASQKKTKSKLQILKNWQKLKVLNFARSFTSLTHLLKLLDKMYEYEMDPGTMNAGEVHIHMLDAGGFSSLNSAFTPKDNMYEVWEWFIKYFGLGRDGQCLCMDEWMDTHECYLSWFWSWYYVTLNHQMFKFNAIQNQKKTKHI